tara:strand:+ start:254 stop:487 length:234 start_codon:yes stop_codon:yes gene_type:complete
MVLKKMIRLILFIFVVIGYGCSSSLSDPGVCACYKNALKVTTSSFDQDLQTRCEKYSATLTQSEKEERAVKMFRECM